MLGVFEIVIFLRRGNQAAFGFAALTLVAVVLVAFGESRVRARRNALER